jgi:hypothetical protein
MAAEASYILQGKTTLRVLLAFKYKYRMDLS